MLMMLVDKQLPLDKIAHLRGEFGLPADFRSKWVHKYPQHFKVVKSSDEVNYLELVEWNQVESCLGYHRVGESQIVGIRFCPSYSRVAFPVFPLKFAASYKKAYRYGGKIDHFHKGSYLSPYAKARGFQAGSKEFDKRAIAVIHDLLSFTIEKRLVTDHLTCFRGEFMMPHKLMRLLLKLFGIFYVSERGKRFSVFSRGAYEGVELIQKCLLVIWNEKVLSVIGYRGRKKKIETFVESSDMEDNDFLEGCYVDGAIAMHLDQDEAISELEDIAGRDRSFMDISEIDNTYKPHDSI